MAKRGVNLGNRPIGPVIDGGGAPKPNPAPSGVTIDKIVPPSPIMKNATGKPPSNNYTFNSGYNRGYESVRNYGPSSNQGSKFNAQFNRAPNASGAKSYVAAERALNRELRDVAFRDFKGLAPKGYNIPPAKGAMQPKFQNPDNFNMLDTDNKNFYKPVKGLGKGLNFTPSAQTGGRLGLPFDNAAALKDRYGELMGAKARLRDMRNIGATSLFPQNPGNRNSNFDSGFDYGTGGGVGFSLFTK